MKAHSKIKDEPAYVVKVDLVTKDALKPVMKERILKETVYA